ncbi:hypothetical protein CEUSTIGMA_g2111.t1 [Chlamydomonas eustigma]|uniref:SUN domain-containing protein n=1 Tax=Chlamydomonas eustigma TaxID=1157962 RepID=A0A250WV01_9CHLO|nr:hypothetical protein CEUSTIGMA_g2111.t1 [Chlamydomonas eustigma]|eukprot:GAX74663.1 hypothetical protein CEUSTIGMA_g2111.t1 [Chlamydomonas eustigma]
MTCKGLPAPPALFAVLIISLAVTSKSQKDGIWIHCSDDVDSHHQEGCCMDSERNECVSSVGLLKKETEHLHAESAVHRLQEGIAALQQQFIGAEESSVSLPLEELEAYLAAEAADDTVEGDVHISRRKMLDLDLSSALLVKDPSTALERSTTLGPDLITSESTQSNVIDDQALSLINTPETGEVHTSVGNDPDIVPSQKRATSSFPHDGGKERISKRKPTLIPDLEEFESGSAALAGKLQDLIGTDSSSSQLLSHLSDTDQLQSRMQKDQLQEQNGLDAGHHASLDTVELSKVAQQEGISSGAEAYMSQPSRPGMSVPNEASVVQQSLHSSPPANGSQGQAAPEEEQEDERRINLASSYDGAQVIAANKEARYADRAIDDDDDSYVKNLCSASKWLVLELSQLGRVDIIELTNREMYSSRVKDFVVKGRQVHPKRDGHTDYTLGFNTSAWLFLGNFTAANGRGTQSFVMSSPRQRVRYLLVQFLTHYGNEEVCALNQLKVLGVSAAQELEAALARHMEGGIESEQAFTSTHLTAPEKMQPPAEALAAVEDKIDGSSSSSSDGSTRADLLDPLPPTSMTDPEKAVPAGASKDVNSLRTQDESDSRNSLQQPEPSLEDKGIDTSKDSLSPVGNACEEKSSMPCTAMQGSKSCVNHHPAIISTHRLSRLVPPSLLSRMGYEVSAAPRSWVDTSGPSMRGEDVRAEKTLHNLPSVGDNLTGRASHAGTGAGSNNLNGRDREVLSNGSHTSKIAAAAIHVPEMVESLSLSDAAPEAGDVQQSNAGDINRVTALIDTVPGELSVASVEEMEHGGSVKQGCKDVGEEETTLSTSKCLLGTSACCPKAAEVPEERASICSDTSDVTPDSNACLKSDLDVKGRLYELRAGVHDARQSSSVPSHSNSSKDRNASSMASGQGLLSGVQINPINPGTPVAPEPASTDDTSSLHPSIVAAVADGTSQAAWEVSSSLVATAPTNPPSTAEMLPAAAAASASSSPAAAAAPASSSMEGLLMSLWASGFSSKGKQAGNLFDIFKQEFLLLKLNQTRMAKYMSQVVQLINRNAQDVLQEVQEVEDKVGGLEGLLRSEIQRGHEMEALHEGAFKHWQKSYSSIREELHRELAELRREVREAAKERDRALQYAATSAASAVAVLLLYLLSAAAALLQYCSKGQRHVATNITAYGEAMRRGIREIEGMQEDSACSSFAHTGRMGKGVNIAPSGRGTAEECISGSSVPLGHDFKIISQSTTDLPSSGTAFQRGSAVKEKEKMVEGSRSRKKSKEYPQVSADRSKGTHLASRDEHIKSRHEVALTPPYAYGQVRDHSSAFWDMRVIVCLTGVVFVVVVASLIAVGWKGWQGKRYMDFAYFLMDEILSRLRMSS